MKTITTKHQLSRQLYADLNELVQFVDPSGKLHVGSLSSIQREDGSGCSFNITLSHGGVSETFHFRTQD